MVESQSFEKSGISSNIERYSTLFWGKLEFTYEGSWRRIDFAYQLRSCMWDYLKSTRDKVRMPHMCTWPHWCLESKARCLTAVFDWSTEQRWDLPIFKGVTYRLLILAIWSSIFFLNHFKVKIFGEEYGVISYLARIFYPICYQGSRCCHQLRKQSLNQKSSIQADDANRRWSARIVQSRWNPDNH